MSSDKTRFSITVDEAMFKKIEDFRFDRRIKSQSKAVNELILIGLESLSGNKVTIGPTLSKAQIDTIEKYDSLDEHGKVIIDFILEKEYERCTASSDPLQKERQARRSLKAKIENTQENMPAYSYDTAQSAFVIEVPPYVTDTKHEYEPNAAHSRTDIKVPEDADTSEDDIMDDEDF